MKGSESVPIVLLKTITAARTVMFVGYLCSVHIYWIFLRVEYSLLTYLTSAVPFLQFIHARGSYKLKMAKMHVFNWLIITIY